ncbi:MAG: hypothetical protein N2044_09495 [Cyclobacteriaceae bacterium]|nr:hypothetical protein [Cyclobacteriaceae bacterium]
MRIAFIIFLCSYSVCAQTISEQLQNYYAYRKPVVAHLHFNQPTYAPGDTAYFRAALLDAASLLPIQDFQLMYIDVVSEDGHVVLHQEFRIRDGWGGNQLAIPESFKPGLYKVYAYNDWMKNFGKEFFFNSELFISGSHALQCSKQGALKAKAEGGTLVAGVQNRIIVTGTLSGSVVIQDASGKVLMQQPVDSSGLTSVLFTPPVAGTYTIKVNREVTTIPAKPDGVAVMFIPSSSSSGLHRLILTVPVESALRNQELQVLVSHHNLLALRATVKFSEKNMAMLTFPAKSLAPGINYLSVNRLSGETLATRVFYNPYSESVKCNLLLDSQSFQTRQSIRVRLKVSDLQNNPVQARISATVYNQDLFRQRTGIHTSIDDYIRWTRDIRPLENSAHLSDLLLIASEWLWYRWEDVSGKLPEHQHLFTGYQQISGNVINRDTGEPVKDRLRISLLNSVTNDFYEINTNEEGAFSLSFLFPFYTEADLFYRIEKNNKKLNEAVLALHNPGYTYPPLAYSCNTTSVPDHYYNYARQHRQITESYRYFGQTEKPKNKPENLIEQELGEPDAMVDLDDYILFPTMQETLHEIIPYLQYRKAGGRETLRMYIPELARSGEESPLFIIDGAITDQADFFLQLKPSDVDKIKIYYSQYKTGKLGSLSHNGVVVVETKLPDYATKVAASSRTLKIKGLSPSISFPKKPEFWQEHNSRAPRLRSTLYFNPVLRLNEEGEANFTFTATDDVGTFVVEIEGLTTEGIPFTAKKTFTIKYRAD